MIASDQRHVWQHDINITFLARLGCTLCVRCYKQELVNALGGIEQGKWRHARRSFASQLCVRAEGMQMYRLPLWNTLGESSSTWRKDYADRSLAIAKVPVVRGKSPLITVLPERAHINIITRYLHGVHSNAGGSIRPRSLLVQENDPYELTCLALSRWWYSSSTSISRKLINDHCIVMQS